MIRRAIVVAGALLAACSSSGTFLLVDASSSAPLTVGSLAVTVTNSTGRKAMFTVTHGASFTMPPDATFTIQFADGTSGEVTVDVRALSPNGDLLVDGVATATIATGTSTPVDVALGGITVNVDMGDMAGCGAGENLCHGTCVNTASDPANCGSCGHRCDDPCLGCQNGSCGNNNKCDMSMPEINDDMAGDMAISIPPDLAATGSDVILFSSNRSGSWQLWTVHSDGTGLAQLTFLSNAPNGVIGRWSPDGKRIAYIVGSSAKLGQG